MTESIVRAPESSFALVPKIRAWWARYDEKTLRVASWLMTIAGGVWLGYQFWRLLFQTGYWGAIDLGIIQGQLQHLISGVPVYSESKSVLYPPASYLMLFPFLGWLDFDAARWLWSAVMVLSLIALVAVVVRASGADSPSQRAFIALVPLSLYAAGAAIGNGQLIVLVLPILIAGISLATRALNWRDDLIAAFLILFALVKPSVSAPFFWIAVFVLKRFQIPLLVIAGYIGLTFWAASFQTRAPWVLLRDWISGASVVAQEGGYFDLNSWFFALGWQNWSAPFSIALMLGLGAWIYWYRDTDLWILLGVTAIVARLWTYHNWYDDLLILVPMLTLYRIAKRGDPIGRYVIAGILLALLIPAMIAPGGLYLFPQPLNFIYLVAQAALWTATLIFLFYLAHYERQRI